MTPLTVNDLLLDSRFELVSESPSHPIEIEGYYIGDLLSFVMAKAGRGQLWLTVQTHPNVIAVASLLELSAVMIVEDAPIPEETINVAKEKGIALFKTSCTAVEILQSLPRLN